MIILGCDFHPSYQQIAMLDTETGVTTDHKLTHAGGEAERFYQGLASAALVGVEAVGNDQWFVRLLQRLDHRGMGRRCSADSCQLCAETEDRSPRC